MVQIIERRTIMRWQSVALGIAMLLGIVIPAFISLVNTIGLGKACGKVFTGLLVSIWVLAGVILIVRGLNKM